MNRYIELLSQVRSDKYNCVNFIVDYYRLILKSDISEKVKGLFSPQPKALAQSRRHFNKCDKYEPHSIVAMNERFTNELHVGVYYDGKVYHLFGNTACSMGMKLVDKFYKNLRYYSEVNPSV